MKETQYKILVDGKSCHGGDMKWSLPRRVNGEWRPGKWHKAPDGAIVCYSGLHLTTYPDRWLRHGCKLFIAQGRGQSDREEDKTAFTEARLLRPARLPAWWQRSERFISSIGRVKWFSRQGPVDPKWKLTEGASWDAAWADARDAAWTSPGAASWNAARDAARAAARAAARVAARADAWTASWNAARDAAADAAWDAAGTAAWECLCNHLCADRSIDQPHRDILRRCWEVWERGYGLVGEVNGVLYVYAGPARKAVTQ